MKMKNLIKSVCMSLILLSSTTFAQELPSTFTYKVGNHSITLLSEGQQKGSSSILIGATEEILKEYVPEGTFPNAMNAFLLQTPEKNILFDTGVGRKLIDNLGSLGITADKIDIVVITHMHGDHIGGMLKDGEKVFSNADVYLSQPEYDYWTDQDKINQLPERQKGSFLNAIKVTEAYKDKLHLFIPNNLGQGTNQIIKDIQGIAAYGHTPGHTVYLIESGKEKLLIWADLTHAMAIQMPYPQIAVTYDVNPDDAIKARLEILKYVENNKIPIAGMHISYPGMGKIEKGKAEGFRFIPFE